MPEEKEKQMEMEEVDTGEERMRNEQIEEEHTDVHRTHSSRTPMNKEDLAPLFENNEAEQFRTRWLEIQSRFVDDPSVSVKDADELVAEVIKNITRTFSDRRLSLENQWKSGDKVSTEDLRVAMQSYRSFFNRLLSLQS